MASIVKSSMRKLLIIIFSLLNINANSQTGNNRSKHLEEMKISLKETRNEDMNYSIKVPQGSTAAKDFDGMDYTYRNATAQEGININVSRTDHLTTLADVINLVKYRVAGIKQKELINNNNLLVVEEPDKDTNIQHMQYFVQSQRGYLVVTTSANISFEALCKEIATSLTIQ